VKYIIQPAHINDQGIYQSGKRCWDNASELATRQQGLAAILNLGPSEQTVSMTCLGRHGRWGNSLLQYVFLRAFALKYSLEYETPKWVGRYLLGLDDPQTRLCYDNVVMDSISEIHNPDNHYAWSLDPSAQRASYLTKKLGRNPFHIHTASQQDQEDTYFPFSNADLEGLFMVHTSHLQPSQKYLHTLIKPAPDLQNFLNPCVQGLRAMGKTIIGIHLRRRDFTTSAAQQNFELITPVSTYVNWLKSVWTSLDDPVLFIASDDINAVASAFHEFNPITSKDLHARMPTEMDNPDISSHQLTKTVGFFPDWYLLTQCDILAISNSTFGFTASMFSEHGQLFMRPTFSDKELTPFNPWQSEPVLFFPRKRWLISELWQQQKFQCNIDTHSSKILRLMVIIPHYCRILLVRASTCLSLQGLKPLIKTLLTMKFYLKPRVRYESDAIAKELPKEL